MAEGAVLRMRYIRHLGTMLLFDAVVMKSQLRECFAREVIPHVYCICQEPGKI